ncbi:MAG: hypothetical protein V4687_16245 [Bacteroidota bacterium]
MKKYIVRDWGNEITEVEIEKESDHSIWIKKNGKMYLERKNTSWQTTHDTKIEALTYIRDKFKKQSESDMNRSNDLRDSSQEYKIKASEIQELIDKEIS